MANRKCFASQTCRRAYDAAGPRWVAAAIAGLANKLPAHAARLLGVLTLVRDIDAGQAAAPPAPRAKL
jgi:hypothetical protein